MANRNDQPRSKQSQKDYEESLAIHEAIQRGDASPLARVFNFKDPREEMKRLRGRIRARVRRQIKNRQKAFQAGVTIDGTAKQQQREKRMKTMLRAGTKAAPGMTNIDAFEEMVEAFGEGLERVSTMQYQQYATAVLLYVLEATPYKTGAARNGWMVGINNIPYGQHANFDHALEEVRRIASATIWDNIHIVNNVPYFTYLDERYRITAKAVGYANTVTAPNIPINDIPLSPNSALFRVPAPFVDENLPLGAQLDEGFAKLGRRRRGPSRNVLSTDLALDAPRERGKKYSTFLGSGGEFNYRGKVPGGKSNKAAQMRSLTELRYQMKLFEERIQSRGGAPFSPTSRLNRRSKGGGKPFYRYGKGGF